MADGICVFAENYNGNIEPVVAELVSAAHFIKETTGEKIQAVVAASDCENLVSQLNGSGVDEIYAVRTDRDCTFQDDELSQVIAEMIKKSTRQAYSFRRRQSGVLYSPELRPALAAVLRRTVQSCS